MLSNIGNTFLYNIVHNFEVLSSFSHFLYITWCITIVFMLSSIDYAFFILLDA